MASIDEELKRIRSSAGKPAGTSISDALSRIRSGKPALPVASAPVAVAEPPEAPATTFMDSVRGFADRSGQAVSKAKDLLTSTSLPEIATQAVQAAAAPFAPPKTPGSIHDALQMIRLGQKPVPVGPAAFTAPVSLLEQAGKQVKGAVSGALPVQEAPKGGGLFSKTIGKLLLAPTELALGLPPGALTKIENAVGEKAVSPKAQEVIRQTILSQPFTPSEFQEAIGAEGIFAGAGAGLGSLLEKFPGMAARFGFEEAGPTLQAAVKKGGIKVPVTPKDIKSFIVGVGDIDPAVASELKNVSGSMEHGEFNQLVKDILSGEKKFFVKVKPTVVTGAMKALPAPGEAPAAMPLEEALGKVRAGEPIVSAAPVKAVSEAEAKSLVKDAGADFVGIQKTRQPGKEAMVLFNEPLKNSTLSLPISQMTPENVAAKIQEFAAKHAAAQAQIKAASAPSGPPAEGAPQGPGPLQASGGFPGNPAPSTTPGLSLPEGSQAASVQGPSTGRGALPVHPSLQGKTSVFQPAVPFSESIAQHPAFNKFFSENDAIVRHYAEKMGREITPEFSNRLGGEIHDDIKNAAALKSKTDRDEAQARILQKYGVKTIEEAAFDVSRLMGAGQAVTLQAMLVGRPEMQKIVDEFTLKTLERHKGAPTPAWLSEKPKATLEDALANIRSGKPIESAPAEGYTPENAPVQTPPEGSGVGPGTPEPGAVQQPVSPQAVGEPAGGGVPSDVSSAPVGEVKPELPAPQRFRLKSTGPRTYTVLEELPREPGDLPEEKFLRVKDEKTGEIQVVESSDLQPVKAKPKGMGKEIEPPGSIPQALEERAVRGQAGFLEAQPGTPAQPPPTTPAAKATEDLPPAIEMPELVEISHELLQGKYPKILEKMRGDPGTRGFFSPGQGEIGLRADIAKDAAGAAKTLAHEIGHLIDWLPQESMGRGNILGRIGSLRRYMADMIEAMPDQAGRVLSPAEREKVRSQAVADLIRKSGGTMQQFIKDPVFRKTIAAQVPEMYKRRLEAEAAKRGLITKEQVMGELKRLTQTWKPFDPAAQQSYTLYRHSSPELYADAVSVLFNNPALIKQVSPTFYKAWFDYLERKPQVRDTYMGIVDRIRSGGVQEGRAAGVEGMFAAGERQAAAERLMSEPKPKDIAGWIRKELIDKNEGILSYVRQAKKKGLAIKPEDLPTNWLEEMNYSASEAKGWLQDYSDILNGLEKAGLKWEDLGELQFHRRIIGERAEKFNPRGFTPTTSAAQIEYMRKTLGEEKFKALSDAADAYQKGWNYIKKRLIDSEMLSPQLEKKIAENPDYVTFDVFSKHADELSGGGAGMGAKIYGQVGTLQEISNPATATLMKGVALIKSVVRNDAAKMTAKFLSENFGPEVITPAEERWNGMARSPVEPRGHDKGLLTYMEGGRLKGFVVDKAVADAFKRDPESIPGIVNVMRQSQAFFREVFVQKNPGFMAFNLIRDFFRAYKNLPKAGLTDVAKYYYKSLSQSFRRGFDIPDPLVKEMLEKRMLITMEERWGLATEDEQVRALMDRYFSGKGEEGGGISGSLKRLGKWVGDIGSAIEAMPKMAGYKYLKEHQAELGLSDQQIAHMIRTQVGSPDFLRRGSAYGLFNNVFMFSNAIKEGWRADLEVMKDRPGEYAWKTAQLNLLPKVLMWAAGLGMLGAGTKDIMDRVSEYDKTNYLVIPLGMTENGKAVYIRVPQDEAGRALSGAMWKSMNMGRQKSVSDLLDFMSGQAPNLNPALGMAADVVDYLSGKNPYDHFRQRNVIPDQVFQAGGMRSHEAFLRHLLNSAGAGIVYTFPTDDVQKAKTTAEKVIGAPVLSNTLGRFLKITDYGRFEELKRVSQGAQREEARRSLDERDAVVSNINAASKPGPEEAAKLYAEMLKQGGLRRKGGSSVVPFKEFVENYNRFASRKSGRAELNALAFARSNEERAALLRYYRDTMKKEDYDKVVADAISGGQLKQEPLILSYIEEKKK